MVYITRRERFSAAHRLYRKDWSDEKNLEVFGQCSNKLWHGHNYEMFVTIKGEVNPETGFVINLKELSKILKTKVIDKLDHRNINEEVDFMKDIITSTENLAIAIWNEIKPDVEALNGKLDSIKIYETENNFVEYRG